MHYCLVTNKKLLTQDYDMVSKMCDETSQNLIKIMYDALGKNACNKDFFVLFDNYKIHFFHPKHWFIQNLIYI